MNNSIKLGFFGLTGLVISATVGSGVFALPQNMADGAGAAAVLAAWVITGVGMYFLTDTFRVLSTVRPDLTSGLYAYAKEGFGETAGFFTAWGYWFSNTCAVSAFLVVLMESLNYFFPGVFTGGNNLNSIILSSVVIWCFYFLISKGIKETAFINLLGTIFKLFPIFLFIVILFLTVKLPALKTAFAQKAAVPDVSFSGQIKNAMIITLWAFIGIETTVVLAGRAKGGKTVSAALMTAFLLCIILYICVSILPFGVLTRAQIALLPNPSTAGVLEYIIGRAGGIIMNAGMIVSVFFATLSMTTITSEVPFAAAKDKSFPRQFTKENKNFVPVFSLMVTTLTAQALLFIGFVSQNAFQTLLTITAVMIMPVYLITPLYLLKIANKKQFPNSFNVNINRARLSAAAGALYAVWLIYAANIKYLFIALLFFIAGIPVYLIAKKQK
ncbi:MAG: basic amino acid/polyamine antiporter [Elusimicrobia bacterium]|nr:basic amino acid/polyamine antiporter [Elusimicrobiota bacterium]